MADSKSCIKRRAESHTALDINCVQKQPREHNFHSTLLDVHDHCLLTIFENLNEVDVCQVKNVCSRFVPLADTAFLSIRRRSRKENVFRLDYSRAEFRRVIYKFGHLFQSCIISPLNETFITTDMLQRLTQIRKLTIDEPFVMIDTEVIRMIHSAEHLKELSTNCEFHPFGGNIPLTSLRKKSSLQCLIFEYHVPAKSNFIEFLQHNQKLECLGIPSDVPKDYIPHILRYAKQITEIRFYLRRQSVTAQMVDLLSNLKNLRHVSFNRTSLIHDMCVNNAMTFVKRNVPDLTHLTLDNFFFEKTNIKSICALKKLKYLKLAGPLNHLKTEFISVLAALPLLESLILSVICCCPYKNRDFHLDTLKDIVEFGTQLNLLKIEYVQNLRINEQSYAKLIEVLNKSVRQKRLSVEIRGCSETTSLDVPTHVKRTGDIYLKIDYVAIKFLPSPCKCYMIPD